MNDEIGWLTATAVLAVISFILYIGGVIWKKTPFDLNQIVPLLLSCAASVAAVKMMVLAYTLPKEIAGKPVASLFDSGSILIGGFVFLITAIYGVVTIVSASYKVDINNGGDNND